MSKVAENCRRGVIAAILNSRPRLLAGLFYLLLISFSTLIYRIIRIEDFAIRRKLMNKLVFKHVVGLARRLSGELVIYNARWKYYFIISDSSSYNIMMSSHEGKVPYYLLGLLKRIKDPVFIDIGAHQGFYCLALSPFCKLAVAIEPHPENYNILRRNINMNKIVNCIAVRCAAASYDGYITLYSSQFSDLHSIYSWRNIHGSIKSIKVHAYKLDTLLLEKLGLERIDVVKIDVEGAEMAVLKGMENIICRFKPVIIVEIFQKNLKKVKDFLRQHRYLYKEIFEAEHPITGEVYSYLMAVKAQLNE